MLSLVEKLMELGFSEYEAKAYLALLPLGSTTGYQIAKESGIPRSTIYEVLQKLIARGAVLTQSFADQTRYTAVPSTQLLERMQRDVQEAIEALDQGLQGVAENAPPSGDTWTLTGRRNLFAYARQMIEQARKEVVLLIGDDDELDAVMRYLQGAWERNVAVVVISPTPYDAGEIPVAVHQQGSRMRNTLGHGFILVVDERTVLMGEVDRSESAIWTTNSFVVAWARWCLRQEMAGSLLPPSTRDDMRSAPP
ncbi:MAG TPA: hypothetical protein DEP84_37990 [Chloroflexi bacterium]|nr:hypothetical protein [Chloroflexota bacterium]